MATLFGMVVGDILSATTCRVAFSDDTNPQG